MTDRAGAAGDQNGLPRNRSVAEQAAPRRHAGNTERRTGGERHIIGQQRHRVLGERNSFSRSSKRAAVALAVVKPDSLTHAEPRDAVADLIDNPRAIAVGDHARKLHPALAAGTAGPVSGADPRT